MYCDPPAAQNMTASAFSLAFVINWRYTMFETMAQVGTRLDSNETSGLRHNLLPQSSRSTVIERYSLRVQDKSKGRGPWQQGD